MKIIVIEISKGGLNPCDLGPRLGVTMGGVKKRTQLTPSTPVRDRFGRGFRWQF